MTASPATGTLLAGAPMPAGIFFDWDGTLVNTIPLLRKAHNHVRRALGYPDWSEADFWENLKHSSREIYPRIYGAKSDEAFSILYAYVEANHLAELEPLPGAAGLVGFLASGNVPSGVVSNKRHEYLIREIRHMGWDAVFRDNFGSGSAERDKPHADPLIRALDAAGLAGAARETIWYAGDTATDMLVARNAGCMAVLLCEDAARRAELEAEYKPYLVFGGCAAFLDYLSGLDYLSSHQKSPGQKP